MTPALIVAAVAAVGLAGIAAVSWALVLMGKKHRQAVERAQAEYWANMRFRVALHEIADATRDGKSGTARKVHRMAVEALSGDKPA